MNWEATQPQSANDQQRAAELSVKMNAAPKIPGYTILRHLGAGAYGQVWLASDLNTRRPVAIKCFANRANLNLEAMEREVGLLANMSTGRHIVQVLKVGWDHQPPFFVMEYLEKGSLEEWIRSNPPASPDRIVEIITEIAQGLEFAHSKGVIHCDLKPANVLLDHLLKPRIADFGQGRLHGDQTSSLGTLFYMAPEQAVADALPDVQWDVYSLGAIAHTLLVGSPPYRTAQVTESIRSAQSLDERLSLYRQSILASPPPKLHHRCPGMDRSLATIVDRCLAVDPAVRYQTIQQVVQALEDRLRNRARRPLYLLGIVGPIALLCLMLLFSVRSLSVAVNRSEQSVVQRAMESNRFAAKYAARTLETELQTLFRIAEDEARSEELKQLMTELSQAGSGMLDKIASGPPDPKTANQLRELPQQQNLEKFLQERISKLVSRQNGSPNVIQNRLLNSIFINDDRGNNIGIGFADPQERLVANSPVGSNFAFRSYFTGARVDGNPAEPSSSFRPTRRSSLSSSFRSTSTGMWKIAISTPIWSNQQSQSEDSENLLPMGVLVLTIHLGDFQLLADGSQEAAPQRFATLFDGRQGNQLGTILQHPILEKLDTETLKSMLMPQLPLPTIEALRASGMSDYYDPFAKFQYGSDYHGAWIACVAQVDLPQLAEDVEAKSKSDLWILVQERKQSVVAPIRSLTKSLQRESLIEFLVLISFVAVLWYIVFRFRIVKSTAQPRASLAADMTVTESRTH